MRKTKQLLLNGILLLLSVFFCLAVFEITLRVIEASQNDLHEKWAPTNDARNYENKPSYVYGKEGVVYAINDDGLRADQNYSKQKKATRIALVGDSVTFGLGVNNSNTFAYLIQESLGNQAEVLNFGVPGYGTSAEIETVKAKVLAYDPDVIIVNFVMNDIEPSSVLFPSSNKEQCILPIINVKVSCAFKTAIRNIRVISFFYNKISTLLYTQEDDYYTQSWGDDALYQKNIKNNLVEFKKICQENSIDCAVVVFPLLQYGETYKWESQESKLLRDLDTLNLPYLSLQDAFRRYPSQDIGGTEKDILHPNALGHRIAAQEMGIFIKKILSN